MMKILTVVGARPQFVKTAVLSRAVSKKDNVEEVIVHTGQHFDHNMSDVFFDEMEIPKPQYNLNINGMSHGAMTGHMIIELEKLFLEEKPDYVLVYGDTNSTLAAGLAAKKLNIYMVHVEAGVRNFDESMPEEINRYLVDRISDLNFTCTWYGGKNLEIEGYNTSNINSTYYNVGDVMYDAALFYEKKSDQTSTILDELGLTKGDYIICTVHRASNTDNEESLTAIIDALNRINEEIEIILPIHPRTQKKLEHYNLKCHFRCIEPTGYMDMIQLIKHSRFVVTDSGGVVREAYFFKKGSMLLLEDPLWPELVEEGVCFTAEPKLDIIMDAFARLRSADFNFGGQIFGLGNAGDKILEKILEHYQNGQA